MSEIILKIDEIPQQHVGRGRAIVDPKIIEDQNWNSGQILEITYNKNDVKTRTYPTIFGYGPLKKYPINQESKLPVGFTQSVKAAPNKAIGIDLVKL